MHMITVLLTCIDWSASGRAEVSTMRLANRKNTPVEGCIFFDVNV
jgi:hypothetical protein